MILNETLPEKSLYVLGGEIIEALKYYDSGVEITQLYERVSEKMHLGYFLLSLDWLYLSGAIDKKDSLVIKCF